MTVRLDFKIAEDQKKRGLALNQYRGRNGVGKCNGIELNYFDPSIRINPITSGGYPTETCFIEIPLDEVEKVIEALKTVSPRYTRTVGG